MPKITEFYRRIQVLQAKMKGGATLCKLVIAITEVFYYKSIITHNVTQLCMSVNL